MTDKDRVDFLEHFLECGDCGNGIAIMPLRFGKKMVRGFSIDDLGDEDGSNLGEQFVGQVGSLRDAIDSMIRQEVKIAKQEKPNA